MRNQEQGGVPVHIDTGPQPCDLRDPQPGFSTEDSQPFLPSNSPPTDTGTRVSNVAQQPVRLGSNPLHSSTPPSKEGEGHCKVTSVPIVSCHGGVIHPNPIWVHACSLHASSSDVWVMQPHCLPQVTSLAGMSWVGWVQGNMTYMLDPDSCGLWKGCRGAALEMKPKRLGAPFDNSICGGILIIYIIISSLPSHVLVSFPSSAPSRALSFQPVPSNFHSLDICLT
ncbi:hypothetical protein V2G26_015857 [Clonostachys chloroleuca]